MPSPWKKPDDADDALSDQERFASFASDVIDLAMEHGLAVNTAAPVFAHLLVMSAAASGIPLKTFHKVLNQLEVEFTEATNTVREMRRHEKDGTGSNRA
jgi:hypothetical protein